MSINRYPARRVSAIMFPPQVPANISSRTCITEIPVLLSHSEFPRGLGRPVRVREHLYDLPPCRRIPSIEGGGSLLQYALFRLLDHAGRYRLHVSDARCSQTC